MQKVFLVFPHQLFYQLSKMDSRETEIVFYEADHFFSRSRFHKQKLMLHRASMQALRERLLVKRFLVRYIEWVERVSIDALLQSLRDGGIEEVELYEVHDHILQKELEESALRHDITLIWHTSPAFLLSTQQAKDYLAERRELNFDDYYSWHRRHLNLLLTEAGKPMLGEWKLDRTFMERLPEAYSEPGKPELEDDRYIVEAREYVEEYFPNNPGVSDNFQHPYTYDDALELLETFITERLQAFDLYHDAISSKFTSLHHARLSSSLNIGLLLPSDILKNVMMHRDFLPVAAIEVILRKTISLREWIRILYLKQELPPASEGYSQLISKTILQGKTGLIPFDTLVSRLHHGAYIHAREREVALAALRLFGLSEEQIHQWFLENFIDSYNWVLLPNLRSSQQWYIDSSWICRISDYPIGGWGEIWDALILKAYNSREIQLSTSLLERFLAIGEARARELLEIAEKFEKTVSQ